MHLLNGFKAVALSISFYLLTSVIPNEFVAGGMFKASHGGIHSVLGI